MKKVFSIGQFSLIAKKFCVLKKSSKKIICSGDRTLLIWTRGENKKVVSLLLLCMKEFVRNIFCTRQTYICKQEKAFRLCWWWFLAPTRSPRSQDFVRACVRMGTLKMSSSSILNSHSRGFQFLWNDLPFLFVLMLT